MPELVGLRFQGGDSFRVVMAERVDRDTGNEVEPGFSFSRIEADTFTALENEIRRCISVHKRCRHEVISLKCWWYSDSRLGLSGQLFKRQPERRTR